MCVEWVSDWEVVTQDMTAYKFVERSGDKFISPLPPDKRGSQHPTGEVGAVLEYIFDKETVSDYPGIYCLMGPVRVNDPQATLRVTIPKGTMIRRGKTHLQYEDGRKVEVRTVNALKVIPRDEYTAPQPQMWNIANTLTTNANVTLWGYINMSNTATTCAYWTNAV